MLKEENVLNRRSWILGVLQSCAGLRLAHALPDTEWKPQFLSGEQNETLVSLGERIVPGSSKAGCHRVLDLLMTLESDHARKALVSALAAFDEEAVARHGEPYRKISVPQQDAVLMDTAAGKLSAQFQLIKEWIADVYWSSEEGMRELGWTNRMSWESFPGCEHSGQHR
jgi:hypothetical protein